MTATAATAATAVQGVPSRSQDERVPPVAGVVVAGGGVIGLSLAFELARRGEPVVVLERDHVAVPRTHPTRSSPPGGAGNPGAGAGGVAAGMLAPAAEAEHGSVALIELAQDSMRRYPDWARTLEAASGARCGLRQEGTLLVALSRDDEDELGRIAHFQHRYGVAAHWLSADEVLAVEPQLSARVTAGLSAPDDHQVDAQAMLAALALAVTALGGRIVEGATVTGFETEGGRLRRVTGRYSNTGDAPGEAFAVRCETAVMAAGAWSGLDMAWPAAPLGVRPVKGQLLHLRGADLIQHVVRSPHVYLVPRAGGTLVVGATMEEQGFDASPTAGAVMDLLWNARLVLPGVYDLALADVRVGFRPATRDHEPVIGETEIPGLYVATGHFRHGVLLAPATAALLADQIVGGGTSPLIEPFRPKPAQREAAVARR